MLSRDPFQLVPLIQLGSKSTSLSAVIHMLVQALQNDLFVSGIFLPFSAC